MEVGKRGRWSAASVHERADVDIVDLVAELRDLFNKHPALARSGAESLQHELLMLRGVRVSVFDIERALEVLRDEESGEVLA